MNRLSTLFAACLLLTLAGCNAILGIEKAKVVPRDQVDGSAAPCDELDACAPAPTPCTTAEECETGQACVDGACVAPEVDGGPAPDAGDAASDAPQGDGGSDAGCVENEFRCEGAALPTRLQCVGGVWKSGAACENGQLCDSQSTPAGACKPVVDVCLGQKPSQPFCAGAERVVCGPDLVTATRKPCGETALCNLGTGADCAACNRNDAKCEGNDLLLCKTDYSGFAFSQTCNAGECRANLGRCTSMLCERDAWSCEGNVLQHCNDTGTGYIEADRKDCGAGICDKMSGTCKACENNANLGCADDTHQSLCSADGSQKLTRACSELSSATPSCVGTGVCVQCSGSKGCQSPTTAIACSGQGVATPSMCTGTTCVTGKGCTGECAPETYKCAGNAGAGRAKCGPEGLFNQSEMCEANNLCDTATGQCKPVIEGCANQAVGTVVCVGSKRVTCGKDLVNATIEQCGSPTLCSLGTGSKCATCTDSDWECRQAELWKCNATHDAMIKDQTCTSADLCNAPLHMCTDKKCDPGKTYCDGTTLKTCNASGSAVLTSTPCPSGICDPNNGNAECDQCNANEYLRCNGNSRVRCNGTGQGEVLEACSSPTPVCSKATCVQCQPDSNTCSADLKVATHCDSNGSRTTENCAANETCINGDCGGICGPGQYKCGTTGTAERTTCGPNGTFSVAANCASGEACDATTRQCKTVHPACTATNSANQWVCWNPQGGAKLQRVQCSEDRLSVALGNSCGSADLCAASSLNVCASCLAGQRQCSQANTQKCDGGQWVNDGVCTSAMWCSGGACQQANCTPGSWKCANDGKNHLQCDTNGEKWVQQGSCGYCDGTSSTTAAICYQCQPNSYAQDACWDGSNRKKCNSGGTAYAAESCTVSGSPGPFCVGTNKCVQCTTSVCQGATTARICVGGTYQPKDCVALNQTCFTQSNGVPDCGGSCVKDRRQCATRMQTQLCDANGVWQPSVSCSLSPPQVCDSFSAVTSTGYGTCIDNSPRPYDPTGGGSGDLECFDRDLFAQPFIAPDNLFLTRLGVRTLNVATTANAFVSLHSDASGQPGMLINRTDQFGIIAASMNFHDVWFSAAANTQLIKNTKYWIVLKVSSPGANPHIAHSSTANAAGAYRLGSQAFGIPGSLSAGITAPATGSVSLLYESQK